MLTNSIGINAGSEIAWKQCYYCNGLEFKIQDEFIKHLRQTHCTKEGGSFVCRYGFNEVCYSLPVDGVSDKDYRDHVVKHHVNAMQTAIASINGTKNSVKKMSRPGVNALLPSVVGDSQWTVYSGSQNLPAVLNDPNAGKQRDFFTKLWGEGFVEKTDVPRPHHFPEITNMHFEMYRKKFAKRMHRHTTMGAGSTKSQVQDLRDHFPSLRIGRSVRANADSLQLFDLSEVPRVFTEPNIDLSDLKTFTAAFGADASLALHERTARLDQLTTYLDLVEVQIARQVAHKSDSFFHAMTSHDALMEQLGQTITVVTALRTNIQHIDGTLVKDSLAILRAERARRNNLLVYHKLKLMSSVRETQPMIQLLLSTPDYVAALDLISTTQEILAQELAGVHSFRHLGPQLLEMERMIDKMLAAEFQRYATADLNRPLTDTHQVLQGDKLVSIVLGMLRQKHFSFVDTYKDEAFTTMKAIVKQTVIEVIAASDAGDRELALTGLGDEVQTMALHDWIRLVEDTTQTLLRLILRVRAAHDVMAQAAAASAGRASGDMQLPIDTGDEGEYILTAEQHTRVAGKLADLMTAVCDCAHERVAQLVTAQAPSATNTNSNTAMALSGEPHAWTESSYWLVDKATAAQVCDLARVMDHFTSECEKVCGRASHALRSAFNVQIPIPTPGPGFPPFRLRSIILLQLHGHQAEASKFVQRFHAERKTKLGLLLDSERWKRADVPAEFQALLDHVAATGTFAVVRPAAPTAPSTAAAEIVWQGEKYAVVGTALLLVKMIAEYCVCGSDLAPMAPNLCRQLAELLQLFNSRCCQLVLGAGALHLAGLKTITSTNLVLASRALHLVLALLPSVSQHFQGIVVGGQTGMCGPGVNALESVARDMTSHAQEIRAKVQNIVNSLVCGQLAQWDAKPPVPSHAFRTISKHLTKLHEAVSSVLPATQVHDLYRTSNRTLKDKLREQLAKMNIVNNGGPQHGVVTSELTFYVQTLKTLQALPTEELGDSIMDDIWRAGAR